MRRQETIEELRQLFINKYGRQPQIEKIAGGGSPREYYRLLNNGISVIGVVGDDIKENETFIKLAGLFCSKGLSVPRVIAVSDNKNCYLQQDLGHINLLEVLKSDDKIELAKSALRSLIDFQTIPEDEWKDIVGYKEFSERLVKWDLNYFKYDFLKPAGIRFNEDCLEDDFEALVGKLVSPDTLSGLMYRDFQSRNIMVNNNKLWFIDFQGARKGPMVYDAVSFIWQAKAPFSYEDREFLGEYYASLLPENKKNAIESMESMQVFRTLQVLGAYGFRGLIEGKSHFLDSIPLAISNLIYLEEKGRLKDYPELTRIADEMKKSNSEKIKWGKSENDDEGKLTVSVCSFSYKKGYPKNYTGNGGGFMFDCRGLHNPGRYDEYKVLTGKDKAVIEFLEEKGEVSEFVERTVGVVKPSIEKYIERGFTSLQVGFGCTGGRHRSVYCTEKFGDIIKKKYPQIKVEICHTEENNW